MNVVGALMGVIAQTQAITEQGQGQQAVSLAMLARLRGENQAIRANARRSLNLARRAAQVRPSLIQF